MKRSLYIIGGLALAISMPSDLQAQTTQPKDTTMNRTVVVEQEYNPDIMDASKVNVLPKVEEPTVSKKEVEYATTFFPATSVPAGLMNPYTGKEVQPGSTPGYVRAKIDAQLNKYVSLSNNASFYSSDYSYIGVGGPQDEIIMERTCKRFTERRI